MDINFHLTVTEYKWNKGGYNHRIYYFLKGALAEQVSEELLHFAAFMVCLTLARLGSFEKMTPANTKSHQCVGNPQDLLLPTQLPLATDT